MKINYQGFSLKLILAKAMKRGEFLIPALKDRAVQQSSAIQ
jgi:hypothetical protein